MATLKDGSYILGGMYYYGSYSVYLESSEFLAAGSSQWTEGPRLPRAVEGACGVAVSETSMLLIGGRSDKSGSTAGWGSSTFYRTVWEYSTTSSWSSWPSLAQKRRGHACIKTANLVIVAGGMVAMGDITRTTEVINLETKTLCLAGQMASPRYLFGIIEVGFAGRSVVLTFGHYGYNSPATKEDSLLQEFNPTTSSWQPSPAVMDPKYHFSAVTVEASLVCKPGEI